MIDYDLDSLTPLQKLGLQEELLDMLLNSELTMDENLLFEDILGVGLDTDYVVIVFNESNVDIATVQDAININMDFVMLVTTSCEANVYNTTKCQDERILAEISSDGYEMRRELENMQGLSLCERVTKKIQRTKRAAGDDDASGRWDPCFLDANIIAARQRVNNICFLKRAKRLSGNQCKVTN
eukprot:m.260640 g.260640  ORF g.260640 m.260640 type:complete len:183 (+) comp16213_c0_seq4:290-838(+)